MKQSAVKTLGVAALGAAFAAVGAGAANAAPATVPDPSTALETVTSTLPLDQAASTLPAGAPESLAAGQSALASGVGATGPAVEHFLPALSTQTLESAASAATEPADDQGEDGGRAAAPKPGGDPVGQLLGGLPTGEMKTQGLPTQGLGLPL
ncbi:ATP-binding protein [Streptomyces spectabilis]|uniref:ATP-binding protein n=1 Tax=Streptomyces spectabilis TaxID=68270 RepID=A0A516RCH4_STRST|nr:ATP-binding protein [Streptomyces spectabilis]QDQ13355.1 ATP-binding protein [Streptomyces spectabilis]